MVSSGVVQCTDANGPAASNFQSHNINSSQYQTKKPATKISTTLQTFGPLKNIQ